MRKLCKIEGVPVREMEMRMQRKMKTCKEVGIGIRNGKPLCALRY